MRLSLKLCKPAELFLGLRYFGDKKGDGFLSFMSLVSTIGLALGIAVLVTTLSVLNGFERELKSVILGIVPQASITSKEIEKNWQSMIDVIKDHDDNVESVAPFLQVNSMLSLGDSVQGVVMIGVEPTYEKQVSILDKKIISGSLDDLNTDKNLIILGKKNVSQLGLALGDDVTMIIPKASSSAAGITPQFRRFVLAGVYRASPQIESQMVFVSMKNAAQALNVDYGAQGFRMKLKDIFKASQSADMARQINPDVYYAESWMDSRGRLYREIRMQKVLLGFMLFLIVLVATFNIIASLVVTVTDKRADMAILKTMGFEKKHLKRIFLVQGMSIAFVGVGVGVFLGLLLSLSIGSISAWVNDVFSLGLFSNYYVDRLPSDIQILDVVIIATAAFLTVFVSALYPASRAAKVIPSNELRAK